MTTIRPRASRAATAAVYEDLQSVVRATAAAFCTRYNVRDREEAQNDAMLHFLRAYHSFDPRRGKLGPRVRSIVWNRLLDGVRHRGKRAKRCRAEDVDLAAMAAPESKTFDRESFTKYLSPDARAVVQLLLDAPAEIWAALRGAAPTIPEHASAAVADDVLADAAELIGGAAERYRETAEPGGPAREPESLRHMLRRALAGMGWPAARIGEAFIEIAAALNPLPADDADEWAGKLCVAVARQFRYQAQLAKI